MNVYTTKFEGIYVYSTARKAIMSVGGGTYDTKETSWCHVTSTETIVKKGRMVDLEDATESDIKFLIAELGKHGTISLQHGGFDATEIEKQYVY